MWTIFIFMKEKIIQEFQPLVSEVHHNYHRLDPLSHDSLCSPNSKIGRIKLLIGYQIAIFQNRRKKSKNYFSLGSLWVIESSLNSVLNLTALKLVDLFSSSNISSLPSPKFVS